ncbi:MAG: hypothetical protein WCJ55_10030 [Chloroflexales bacterium]
MGSFFERLAQDHERRVAILIDLPGALLDQDRADELHRLLWSEQLEPGGEQHMVNAWYTAWRMFGPRDPLLDPQLTGYTGSYLATIRAARAHVGQDTACAESVLNRGRLAGLQVGYALIAASLASLAGRVPRRLLVALAHQQVWTTAQSLAYVRLLPNDEERAQAFVGLAPLVGGSDALAEQAIASVSQLTGGAHKLAALAALMPHLSWALHAQALDLVDSLDDTPPASDRAAGLTRIIPLLQPAILPRALDLAASVRDLDARAEVLCVLLPRLDGQHIARIADLTSQMHYLRIGGRDSRLLTALSEAYARHGHVEAAIEIAERIWPDIWHAVALARISPHLTEPLRAETNQRMLCLAACTFERDDREWSDGSDRDPVALVELLPLLPEDWFHAAVWLILRRWEPTDGAWLFPRIADRLQHSPDRCEAIFRHALILMSDQGDSRFENNRRSEMALIALTHVLPRTVLAEAMAIAHTIVRSCISRSGWLMQRMPSDLRNARMSVLGISGAQMWQDIADSLDLGDILDRAPLIAGLVARDPEALLPEAMRMIGEIEDEIGRVHLLASLTPWLDDSERATILALALKLNAATRKARYKATAVLGRALARLAAVAPPPLRSSLFQLAEASAMRESSDDQIDVLLDLTDVAPAAERERLTRRALMVAETIADRRVMVQTLVTLSPHLSDDLQREALPGLLNAFDAAFDHRPRDSVANNGVQADREKTAFKLFPVLVRHGYTQKVMDLLGEMEEQARVLPEATIVGGLPLSQRAGLFKANLRDAQKTKQEESWLRVIVGQLSALGPDERERIYTIASNVSPPARLHALAALAPHMDEQQRATIEEQLWAGLEKPRSLPLDVLAACVAALRQPLAEYQRQTIRDLAIERLAAASTWEELAQADIEREFYASAGPLYAMIGLDPGDAAQPRSLLALRDIAAVVALERSLGLSILTPALGLARAVADERHRLGLLAALTPYLPQPDREQTARDLWGAVGDGRPPLAMWEHAQVIATVMPYLPPDQQLSAFAAVLAMIGTKDIRPVEGDPLPSHLATLFAGVGSIPYAPLCALWDSALHTLERRPRAELLATVQILIPLIVALGGKSAADAVFRHIQQVCIWWP